MNFKKLVADARSCRRFQADKPLSAEQLTELVDIARIAPSASNLQPLRYGVSVSAEKNAVIFTLLHWAAQLKDWRGPTEAERPTGYIVIGSPSASSKNTITDLGIAAQTMQLAAKHMGLGCCMFGNVKLKAAHEAIGFPDDVEVMLVLALGYPAENVYLETLAEGQHTAYWRDEKDDHHVPKRPLNSILLSKFE